MQTESYGRQIQAIEEKYQKLVAALDKEIPGPFTAEKLIERERRLRELDQQKSNEVSALYSGWF